MRHLPLLLTLLRAALAPVVVALALWRPSGLAFGACLAAAFVSDIYDGILARRLGVATPGLRRLDSITDTVFYVAATFALWHLHPTAITGRLGPLAVLLGLEVARYAVDYAKFRREAAYHMWSSKAWGIALFLAFVSVLAFDHDGVLVSAAVWLGIVADLEGLAISAVLPRWQTDVPSVVHAVRLRRLTPPGSPTAAPPVPAP